MQSESNETPVKLEVCLVATHEKKEVIENYCRAINIKPQWLKEKKQGKYFMARLWFKRRLPADFLTRLDSHD